MSSSFPTLENILIQHPLDMGRKTLPSSEYDLVPEFCAKHSNPPSLVTYEGGGGARGLTRGFHLMHKVGGLACQGYFYKIEVDHLNILLNCRASPL